MGRSGRKRTLEECDEAGGALLKKHATVFCPREGCFLNPRSENFNKTGLVSYDALVVHEVLDHGVAFADARKRSREDFAAMECAYTASDPRYNVALKYHRVNAEDLDKFPNLSICWDCFQESERAPKVLEGSDPCESLCYRAMWSVSAERSHAWETGRKEGGRVRDKHTSLQPITALPESKRPKVLLVTTRKLISKKEGGQTQYEGMVSEAITRLCFYNLQSTSCRRIIRKPLARPLVRLLKGRPRCVKTLEMRETVHRLAPANRYGILLPNNRSPT